MVLISFSVLFVCLRDLFGVPAVPLPKHIFIRTKFSEGYCSAKKFFLFFLTADGRTETASFIKISKEVQPLLLKKHSRLCIIKERTGILFEKQ